MHLSIITSGISYALNSKVLRKLGKTFFSDPETPIYTGFRRAHFESQLSWHWLAQVRLNMVAGQVKLIDSGHQSNRSRERARAAASVRFSAPSFP